MSKIEIQVLVLPEDAPRHYQKIEIDLDRVRDYSNVSEYVIAEGLVQDGEWQFTESLQKVYRALEDIETVIDVATKCADCHLFVDENDSFRNSTPEFPIAEYIHLIRGDCPLEEELDANHEPRPGPTATLDWWRENGPYEMRARFEVARQERERDEERRALVRRMDELPERLTPEQRAEYDDLMRRVRALGGES